VSNLVIHGKKGSPTQNFFHSLKSFVYRFITPKDYPTSTKTNKLPGTPFICLIIFVCRSMAEFTISNGSSIFHCQLFPTGFV
jgi:hypothetical protein